MTDLEKITEKYIHIAEIVDKLQKEDIYIQNYFHIYIVKALEKNPKIFNTPEKHLETYIEAYTEAKKWK